MGDPTEEQEDYRRSLRDWLGAVADPATVRRWQADGDTASFTRRLETDGFGGVGLPEPLGGQGGGLVELAITATELGRACAPSAAWLAGVIAARAVGAVTGGSLLVPADAVPHLVPPLTFVAGRVSGTVRTVLASDAASYVVVGRESDALRLGVVPAAETTRTTRRLLDRSRTACDVTLEGARVELLDLDAQACLLDASARAAVLVAADSLGATERMLELTVAYAGQRRQFGVPIGSFQAVKHAAATMLVGVEAARSVVLFAAASVDAEDRDPQWLLYAAAAKAQVTAEGVRAADTALMLHGAVGYTWEHDLQLFYKRARFDEVLYGPPADWNDVIADELDLG